MKTKSIFKWLLGLHINVILVAILYFVLSSLRGWSFGEIILIASVIQMVFIIPVYIKEVKIVPQGAPSQLRGMTENEYNGNPEYMGIKEFPFDEVHEKKLTGVKWYVFNRSLIQQMSYFILMLGIGGYLVFF